MGLIQILDLCAGSGAWSAPYAADGRYLVRRVTLPEDVRLIEWDAWPVHGILAAPPCTVFALSGNRWPRTDDDYRQALSVVDACLRLVALHEPAWWALENPVGKLVRWLGPPRLTFDPCEYGDPYTKRTALWGRFRAPYKVARVAAVERSPIHWMPPGPERAARRSVTPAGFARSFFESNP